MAGISSKAASSSDCGCPNKKGFNGNELQSKEFSDGSGLEVYDFNARTYDQQIGRFNQIDPLLEVGQESLSPYQFGWNNPIRYNDPDGKCPICPFIPLIIEGGKALIAAYVAYTVVDANKENIQKVADNISQTIQDRDLRTKRTEGNNNNQRPDPSKQLEEKKEELQGEIKSLEKSQKSLDKNVKEHQQKLDDYKKNPDKYDNQGRLKDVSPEIRQKRIDGRIKELGSQIKKNRNELQKKTQELEQKKKELNNLNNGN